MAGDQEPFEVFLNENAWKRHLVHQVEAFNIVSYSVADECFINYQ